MRKYMFRLNSFLVVSLLAVLYSCPAQAAQHTVTLKWTPPTAQTGLTVTGYKIYRGTSSGAESTTPVMTITGGSVSSTVDSNNITAGKTYFYQISATGTCDSTVWDCSSFTGEGPKSVEFVTDKAIPFDPAPSLGAPTAASAVVQ